MIDYYIETGEKLILDLEGFLAKDYSKSDDRNNNFANLIIGEQPNLNNDDDLKFLYSKVQMFISEYKNSEPIITLLNAYETDNTARFYFNGQKLKIQIYIKAINQLIEHLKLKHAFDLKALS